MPTPANSSSVKGQKSVGKMLVMATLLMPNSMIRSQHTCIHRTKPMTLPNERRSILELTMLYVW